MRWEDLLRLAIECERDSTPLILKMPSAGATYATKRRLSRKQGPQGDIISRDKSITVVNFNPTKVRKWIEKQIAKETK